MMAQSGMAKVERAFGTRENENTRSQTGDAGLQIEGKKL